MNKNPRAQDLTVGSIPTHLARLSIPMVWGILSVVSMQVADVYFVSRLGQVQLESISFTFPISMTVFNLVMGLSIGASSVIARLIGAQQNETVRHFTLHAIIMAVTIGAGLAIVGELCMSAIFHAMGATPDHLVHIMPFMRVQLWGYMFITVPLVINAALRASGDTLTPSLIMTSAAFLNIPLSYCLVYGAGPIPAFGMTGAAIANVTANGTTAIFSLYILAVKRRLVDLRVLDLHHFPASARRLLGIAMPVGLMNLITPLTATIITALLAHDGPFAVAAYGIIGRVEAVTAIPLMAVSVGMSPLIGQNFGAHRLDRVTETLWYAVVFCIVCAGALGAVLMVSGAFVAGLFTREPATVHMTATYFLLMGLVPMVGNLPIGWASAWNALGQPKNAVILSVGRFGMGSMLSALIGHAMGGWFGLFIGLVVGGLTTGLALHLWSYWTFKAYLKARHPVV